MTDIKTILSIGEPALLEQLAEECSELAQAALKLARRERGENPTPKKWYEMLADMNEEIADVSLCVDMLYTENLTDEGCIKRTKERKMKRWAQRIREAREEETNEQQCESAGT